MKGNQWNCISDDAKDLVHRMLELDQGHRITIDDVLRHPWIRVCTSSIVKAICPVQAREGKVEQKVKILMNLFLVAYVTGNAAFRSEGQRSSLRDHTKH